MGEVIEVKLSELDLQLASFVGLKRNLSAQCNRMKLEAGRRDLGFERHIIGAIGEYAVARALELNWKPILGGTDTSTGDLKGVHVKTIINPNDSLIIRAHDPAELPYVLCLLEMGVVTLEGWIMGHDGKQMKYWRTEGFHRPAYSIPQAMLSKDWNLLGNNMLVGRNSVTTRDHT